ncbi:MAG: STAS domain-containing protein [Erysipelotrichaceae bacterium]|jgi:anti-sigma B factor antagonist|nr:STAS domain-containing protein [Erysipelotrichaceae bacterium]MBQ1300933.1 STAS domain-containing protein [Erysipelotrichaceae bacterium]MBQ1756969.1 STAS domain-containing protein [Erysipelotrichaceae bacterium]MBQ2685199.1 STAS domain-containing protein [Erysipelotrichaceae bacterium]MBR2791210.1 STAS domain-containing protein [Erysipelotrichaceae bacterium]
MDIKKETINGKTVLYLEGRLDTSNSSELEKAVNETLETTDDIELDLSKLEYTSSSGLRVFLLTQKKVSEKGGNLVVSNVNEYIMEIFDITGFSSILNIK